MAARSPHAFSQSGICNQLGDSFKKSLHIFQRDQQAILAVLDNLSAPGNVVRDNRSAAAAASSNTLGSPSRWDGRHTMCASANTAGMSSRRPHHSTIPASDHCFSCASGTHCGLCCPGLRERKARVQSAPLCFHRALHELRNPFCPKASSQAKQ